MQHIRVHSIADIIHTSKRTAYPCAFYGRYHSCLETHFISAFLRRIRFERQRFFNLWTLSLRLWFTMIFVRIEVMSHFFSEILRNTIFFSRNLKKYEKIWIYLRKCKIFRKWDYVCPKWPWLSSDPSNMYPDITFLQETWASAFTDTPCPSHRPTPWLTSRWRPPGPGG